MNMEVMSATKENNTVCKKPKKTDCIKHSDEKGDSDEGVRCSTESVQQEKPESHGKSTLEANLSHPSHQQTLCLTDETPPEQDFFCQRRTAKKHVDRKRKSLKFAPTTLCLTDETAQSTAGLREKEQSLSFKRKAAQRHVDRKKKEITEIFSNTRHVLCKCLHINS